MQLVIARSWPDLGKKIAVALLVIAVLYFGIEQIEPRDDAYDDQVIMVQAVLLATIIAATGLFVINLVFVAPYQLWRGEKERADHADAAITGTEAARAVADCTSEGVVDLARLRAEMDRITDPDREFREEFARLAEQDPDASNEAEVKRLQKMELARLEAPGKAKAEMMRRRMFGRIGENLEDALAKMWDQQNKPKDTSND